MLHFFSVIRSYRNGGTLANRFALFRVAMFHRITDIRCDGIVAVNSIDFISRCQWHSFRETIRRLCSAHFPATCLASDARFSSRDDVLHDRINVQHIAQDISQQLSYVNSKGDRSIIFHDHMIPFANKPINIKPSMRMLLNLYFAKKLLTDKKVCIILHFL